MATAYPLQDIDEFAPASFTGAELFGEDTLITLEQIAQTPGNIAELFDEDALIRLGSEVVEDYERDCQSRQPWADKVEEAMKAAAQEAPLEDKNTPFNHASNVKYPILTIAATEFNARAYPAIVKGDETVQVKVIGSDKGKPMMAQTPQGVMPLPPQPGPDGKPVVQWAIPPGAKAARAARVKDYLNVVLNYRMDDWEGDTDTLLYQLPIAGCGFRKVWWNNETALPCAAYVPALKLVVPMDAKSLETTPRATEEMPDVYPYQIRQRMASGYYRLVEFPEQGEDKEQPRKLLEQHRRMDMDGDGFDEPYIVTVDCESREVLRIEANFGVEDVTLDPETGRVITIKPGRFYIKYDFLPHPEGKFYGIGFGHLLNNLMGVIDTTINQMIDAGRAQIAGGGFIAAGLRLQGSNRTNTLRWQPGEYKVVDAQGGSLRDSVIERTFPNVSPITFQLLELMLGAANDVAAIKDVTSGDASNNGQVGTTLALIEQGLQVFSAIYKRVYRALRAEFQLIYTLLGRWGTQATAEDYATVLDEEVADFSKDFNLSDMDIRPVSDPNSVTRIQKMARAQFLASLRGTGLNDMEINRRILEAADIEDIEKIMPDPNAGPPPGAVAEMEKIESETTKNIAAARKAQAETLQTEVETAIMLGETEGAAEGNGGRVPGMAGEPDQSMGAAGIGDAGQPMPGPMDGGGMEPVPAGPYPQGA